MSAIAKRYARAAVEAASEAGDAGALDSLAAGLCAFRDAFRASEELRELLKNPAMKAHRESVLDAVLEKLAVGPLVGRLIRLLGDNERLDLIDEVADQTEAIADEQAGRLRARVVSAMPLTDEQRGRVTKALERRMGQPVVVNVEVDAEILGGLVCHVGDLTFDSSLKRQIAVLREQLEANVH